jgi:putative acetyltransferase
MHVRPAETDRDLDEVRRLFRAFLSWQRQRHTEDAADLIDAYFDDAAYEREIEDLPGVYSPHDGGGLLVCWDTGLALGCVAYKRLDERSCEMKRMFVAPTARGGGAARALADALLEQARAMGYREMYLDTSIRQTEAITLYRSLGFVESEPYYDVPDELLGRLTFFRLEL